MLSQPRKHAMPAEEIKLAFETFGSPTAPAILLVSVELEEIMALADRILVMFEGRIVGRVDGAKANERHLGLMMANANPILPGA